MVTQPTPPANSAAPIPGPIARRSDFRILWLPAVFCLLLIALEAWLLTHDRAFTLDRGAPAGTPIATYLTGKNSVRKKSAGTLVWEAPDAQVALYREDAIATLEDSEAVVRFEDQSELIVEPNSLVILEQAPAAADPAAPRAIVARLVKGSIKRRNTTAATPFQIKLSRDPGAKPVEFSDTSGQSVFRVIYKIDGYDVIVESGAVTAAGKSFAPVKKLKAPKLHKPQIEIRHPDEFGATLPRGGSGFQTRSGQSGTKFVRVTVAGAWLWDRLFPSARAAEADPAARRIAIRFSWEMIEGADRYHLQVARDPSFNSIVKEADSTAPSYEFLIPAPERREELYFRVAGIESSGAIGEYSSVEKIEVQPAPRAVRPDPIVAKASAPSAPKPAPVAVRPAPSSAPKTDPGSATATGTAAVTEIQTGNVPGAQTASVTAPEKAAIPTPVSPLHFSLAYGLLYGQRNFSRASGNPRESVGSGFTPSQLSVELRRTSDNRSFWSAGGSHLFQKASPELPPPSDSSLPASASRAWLAYGHSFGGGDGFVIAEAGPYFATSRRFGVAGTSLSSEPRALGGLLLSVQNDPERTMAARGWHWRLQAAVLAIGTFGVDLTASVRHPLFRTGGQGAGFAGLEVATRRSGIESSLGAALQLGWWH